MIVVGGDGVFGNEAAISFRAAIPVLLHRSRNHAFEFIDTRCADRDLDRAVLPENPIKRVVIVSESADGAQNQVAPLPALDGNVPCGAKPCRRCNARIRTRRAG
jgi:hypothetical protein